MTVKYKRKLLFVTNLNKVSETRMVEKYVLGVLRV